MKKKLLLFVILFASNKASELFKKINLPAALKSFGLRNIVVGLGTIGALAGTKFSNNNMVRMLLRKALVDSATIFNIQSKKNFTAYNCLEPLILYSIGEPTVTRQYIEKFLGYVLSQEAVFYAVRYAGEKIFEIKTPETLFQWSIWSTFVFKMILVSTLTLKKQKKDSETAQKKNLKEVSLKEEPKIINSENTIKALNDEIKKLQAEIKKLQEDTEFLTKTCSDKETEIISIIAGKAIENEKNLKSTNDLNKKTVELKAEIQTLNNTLKGVTEQNASQNNTIASQENANNLLTKNASEFQTQNRNLNLQIKQLEDTLQHLKKENKLQEDIKNETTKKNILLESHVISLQSRLVIIKNKKCLLEKEINLLTENNNTLQQEIVTLKTMLLEREELVKTIDELTKHNNRLQEEKMCLVAHDTNIKKIKFLESEKNRLVSENLSSTNLLNKKIDELNRCHYVSKQKIDDLEKENQTLKSQMYEMNHTLNTQKNLQNKK